MADDFIELWGRKFEIVKNGLSEDQVVSYINEYKKQNQTLINQQDHLASMTERAEKTIAEAEKLAEEMEMNATEEAKAEANKIVTEAKAQAEKNAEEKKSEIVNTANKEAEDIKANAEREGELIVKRQKIRIYPELKSMVQVVHDQLLSELQNLNKQVADRGVEFKRKLTELEE